MKFQSQPHLLLPGADPETVDGSEPESKPKLDETGRLQFFFLQNITIKASYTEEGLGMCVFELRPAFAKANKVGIELQM